MKPADTFIYVGGSLGLVGGTHDDKRKEFVRTSDYIELQDDVARITLLYTQALNEVEMLRVAGDKMADRLMYQGYPETVPAWRKARGQEFKLS